MTDKTPARLTFLIVSNYLYDSVVYSQKPVKVARLYAIVSEIRGETPFSSFHAFERAFYRFRKSCQSRGVLSVD